MKRRNFLVSGLMTSAALLAFTPRCNRSSQQKPEPVKYDPLADIFPDAGVEGCFVQWDLRDDVRTIVNPEFASKPFVPASTFKIPNTIIGLETGVIPDEGFELPWDGIEREFVPAWNRDHDLRSAMKHSVVWYYQEIARRVGEERYREWLERLDYGNREIGTSVDRFWLDATLRISPKHQVEFLVRLLRGVLPVQERSIAILRDILPSSEADGVTLRAKTGLGEQGPHKVGWLVGFVERPELSHVFASLVLGPVVDGWRDSPVFEARRNVALELLERTGAVPPNMPQPV